jgi:signal transduction histidine kinase/ActR/RegA family two-component response regulator
MNALSGFVSRMSLRWRLTAIFMAASLTAMLVSMGAFVAYDLDYFMKSLQQDLAISATVAASQTEAALTFNDPAEAAQTLRTFGAESHLQRLAIYEKQGRVFASHEIPRLVGVPLPTLDQLATGFTHTDEAISFSRPIVVEGERIGWIYLESNLREIDRRRSWYLSAFALMFILFTVAAFILSYSLQESVSHPISRLAEVARRVSNDRAYSSRAEGDYSREIGDLYQAFNEMLEQIEVRDAKLAMNAEDLKETVERRTEELREANDRLRTELDERRITEERLRESERNLNAALEQAVNATQLKDKFVSLVSHDLRSPLSGVKGMIDILRATDRYQLSESDRKNSLEKIHNSLAGLIELINRLLDISRLQTGSIEPHRRLLFADKLVSDQIDRIRILADRKGIIIHNDIPYHHRILADTELFGEVIYNLLINAVKFTNNGDTITVFIPQGRPSAVAVADNGPGVRKEFLPDLFRHEVKTSSRGTIGEVGTGLGLPYCYDIMRAHGGTLTVESDTDRGSTFYATLPGSKPVILLVDDQEFHREIFRASLSAIEEVAFAEAADGIEALQALHDCSPKLIVTDIQMPNMDGLQLIKTVRSDAKFNSIPILATSACDTDGLGGSGPGEEALALGADAYLSKPILSETLLQVARSLIAGRANGSDPA